MGYRIRKTVLVTTLLAALASGTLLYNARASQSGGSLAIGRQPQTGAGSSPTSARAASSAPPAAVNAASTTSVSAAASVPETQASYQMKSGSFTGQRVNAYYGYVRVQAVVQNGRLQKVNVLEHPNDNGTSRYINSVAMPYLVQEAVQAQGAKVRLISGATLSSEAFVKSLSTALTQAVG